MYHNPYESLTVGSWLKTNFHTHAGTGEGTCGSFPVDFTANLYRRLNYDVLCISNHDLFTDTASLTDEHLTMIPGVEYSHHPHMLSIGVNESFHELSHQEAIYETQKRDGFTILCHPNWQHPYYWPMEQLDATSGYIGIEIINMLIYRLSGSGLAGDVWDYLLRQGKLVYGFGNDDFHIPSDAGRSYTDIYVKERNFTGIKKAIMAGCFTASTGLSLEYLRFENGIISVKACFPIETYIDTFTYHFVTENGLVKESVGSIGEYTVNGERYVRVEVTAENGMMLFTQPVYQRAFFHHP